MGAAAHGRTGAAPTGKYAGVVRGKPSVDVADALQQAVGHEQRVTRWMSDELARREGRRRLDENAAGVPVVSVIDLHAAPPAEIVEGVLWAGCMTMLIGASGDGKSFVAASIGAAVSDGASWNGRATEQGAVVYFAFEAASSMGMRARAMQHAQGRRLEHFYPRAASAPLSPKRDGEESSPGELALAAEIDRIATTAKLPIRMIVIDTARDSMVGSEDASDAVSAYLRAIRRLMTRAPGAACLLLHHAGWQDGETQRRRERGSSAWRGNSDATIYLEAGEYDRDKREALLVLRALKVRDGEQPPSLHLVRRQVELPERDRRGRPVTSCIIELDSRTKEDRAAESAAVVAAAEQEIDLRVLRIIAEQPDIATSLDRIRAAAGLRRDVVRDAVGRLCTGNFALPPARQRQPYTTTDRGRQILHRDISRPESAPLSPASRPEQSSRPHPLRVGLLDASEPGRVNPLDFDICSQEDVNADRL